MDANNERSVAILCHVLVFNKSLTYTLHAQRTDNARLTVRFGYVGSLNDANNDADANFGSQFSEGRSKMFHRNPIEMFGIEFQVLLLGSLVGGFGTLTIRQLKIYYCLKRRQQEHRIN